MICFIFMIYAVSTAYTVLKKLKCSSYQKNQYFSVKITLKDHLKNFKIFYHCIKYLPISLFSVHLCTCSCTQYQELDCITSLEQNLSHMNVFSRGIFYTSCCIKKLIYQGRLDYFLCSTCWSFHA